MSDRTAELEAAVRVQDALIAEAHDDMVRIGISQAAFDAIVAILPVVSTSRTSAPNGDYLVWLDPPTVAKLRCLRGPGDSYSDAILRLAQQVGSDP